MISLRTTDRSDDLGYGDLSYYGQKMLQTPKVLRHRGDVWHGGSQRGTDLEYPCSRCVATSKHRDSRRRTECLLDVAVIKQYRAFGQSIKVWRLDSGIPVTTELWTHIVGSDEQDVKLLVCRNIRRQ